jgi:hypothetical protein
MHTYKKQSFTINLTTAESTSVFPHIQIVIEDNLDFFHILTSEDSMDSPQYPSNDRFVIIIQFFVTISLLAWSQCCQNPIVLTIPLPSSQRK